MTAGGHFGWPKITFYRISRHFRSIRNFDFFNKMAAGGHFGWPKITFDHISRHFKSNQIYFLDFVHKLAAGGHFGGRKSLLIAFLDGHFGWPKITFDRISHHFRSIRPFWMTENHLRSHFILDNRKSRHISRHFKLNQIYFFDFVHKMSAGGHFGWPKITFDRISHHFRSIRNFFFSQNGCRRPFWRAEKSLLITFLTISDQYATFFVVDFFHKIAAGGHFGWPKITFDHISHHFRSIRNFFFVDFFHKMAAGDHFGWPKITFECISRHFRSIRNFFFFEFFCSKWPPAVILEVRFGPFWMTENH